MVNKDGKVKKPKETTKKTDTLTLRQTQTRTQTEEHAHAQAQPPHTSTERTGPRGKQRAAPE